MGEDAKLKIGGDAREALREIARLTNKVKKLEEAGKKVTRTTSGAAKARKDAFGSGALTDIRNYAAALAGIGTTVAAIRTGLRMMKQEREEGAQGMRTAEFALARLAQVVSPGRPHGFLIAEAQKTRLAAGMPLAQAGEMQFALESARLGAERPWLASLHPMMDPVAVGRATGAVSGGFGPQAAGTPRQIVNMLITAAKRASGPESNVTVGEFAAGLAPFGQAFKEIGGKPEELMAAVAAVSRIVGPKKGGMGVGRLAEWIAGEEQQRFQGRGFFGAIERMREETAGMSVGQRAGFVGERRAARGFGWVRENWELIQAMGPEIGAARREPAATDPVARMLAGAARQPELAGPAALRRAEEQSARRREQIYGPGTLEAKITLENIKAATYGRGVTGFLTRAGAITAEAIYPSSALVEAGARAGAATKLPGAPGALVNIYNAIVDGCEKGVRGSPTLGAEQQPDKVGNQ